MRSLCDHWEFTENWFDGFVLGEGVGQAVRLPHNVRELPLHYADSEQYQMLCGYRRKLEIDSSLEGKRLFLQFDGAGHIATVYINGRELATHATGYTGFRVEITEAVHAGENLLAVKLDTTENGQVPPFGFVIDYLTYGGLYREVWLDVREESYIEDIYATTPSLDRLRLQITAKNAADCTCRVELLDEKGKIVLVSKPFRPDSPVSMSCSRVKPWSPEEPNRYTCRVTLLRDGKALDVQEVKIGFRTIQWKADGFYLNGEKFFLRGLNRHQCWPYIGYAAPESLQREDARILKEELGCTIVRTSHYPQSHYFIDECDRLGLLVFTEIPGWQHIGGESWQDQAVENVREMVLQYRNHPSIILWGVRINESMDNDVLYKRTNALARELDPSRPTAGVRNFQKSHLYEDVYTYNDFSHMGTNGGVEKKSRVTPDLGKALMVTEHNGHMFPTKSFDTWQRRQEHALRHVRVQNDAAASGEHAGCIGWCMFDYATHKDFGSGDRICYHGVLDSFRNPKLAAYAYASQQDKTPVLAVGSSMDIGDYPAGNIGQVYVFTNADEVRLYKNDEFVSTLTSGGYDGLPHGPMLLSDTIGDLMVRQEGFDQAKSDMLKKGLMSAARYGLGAMPLKDKLLLGQCMVRYGMRLEDGIALYGKYVGNWGGEATRWRFDAVKNGQVTASATCCPSAKLHLEVKPSHTALAEGATYDMAAVRIRVLDAYGNVAPYAQLPLTLTLEGDAELAGPDTVTAEGGMGGTYVRTLGKTGSASLTVSAPGLDAVTVEFTVVR